MTETVAVPRGALEELLSRFQDYSNLVDGEWPGDSLGDDYELTRRINSASSPVTNIDRVARESGIQEERVFQTIREPDEHPIDAHALEWALGVDIEDVEIQVTITGEDG